MNRNQEQISRKREQNSRKKGKKLKKKEQNSRKKEHTHKAPTQGWGEVAPLPPLVAAPEWIKLKYF